LKKALCLVLCALTLLLTGCQPSDPYKDVPNPIATITMDDGSAMRFELMLNIAPNTVASFTNLANSGFYDGLEFFRVVPGVLVQSGCPYNNGTGHGEYAIKGEFSANGFDNPLSHNRGVISMSRLEDYNSASSQFFILQGNYPEYNGQFAAFGVAMDADTLSVLDSIASQPVDSYYVPLRRQKIATIRVNTHGAELKYAYIPIEEKEKDK